MSEIKRKAGRQRMNPDERHPERVLVSLKTDEYRNLCRLSDEAGLPLSAVVRLLITDWLEKQEGERE